ncbi:MAG: metallophosphoesterase [Prevotella sp.]|nr:metallophosphoesterase [Prevotella sp.]
MMKKHLLLICLTLLTTTMGIKAQTDYSDYFTVVIVSDPHVAQDYGTSVTNMQGFVQNIIGMGKSNGLQFQFATLPGYTPTADLVLCLGDMDKDSEKKGDDFKSAFAALNTAQIPFVTMVGNHDIVPDYWDGDNPDKGLTWGINDGGSYCNDVALSIVTNQLNTAKSYGVENVERFTDGTSYTQMQPFTFTFKGVRFYVGQTYWFQKPYSKPSMFSSATYYAPDGVITSLENFVNNHRDEPSVWMQHYPLVAGSDNDRWWLDQNNTGMSIAPYNTTNYATAKAKRDKLTEIIKMTTNPVHFSGHTHWYAENTYNGVKDYTVTSTFNDNCGAYIVLLNKNTGVVEVKNVNLWTHNTLSHCDDGGVVTASLSNIDDAIGHTVEEGEDVSSLLGENLDFETVQGSGDATFINIHTQPGWRNVFSADANDNNKGYIFNTQLSGQGSGAPTATSLRLRAKWQENTIRQQVCKEVPLPPGSYTLSYYIKCPNQNWTEDLNYYEINGQRQLLGKTTNWSKQEVTIDAGDPSVLKLSFGFIGGNGGNDCEVFVDDIQLTYNSASGTMADETDYLTFLTEENGFVEVTSTNGLVNNPGYYYLLAPEEDHSLVVGIGRYQAKPSWANEETKAMRYVTATEQQMTLPANFFTVEKAGNYIGFRNLVYCADLMQTHDNAGFMYVNTYTDRNLDEWSYLTPTYQDGYWLFESGKYPLSGGNNYSGYLGPWNNRVEAGEALALNRKNTAGDEAGHYRIFRITKADFEALKRRQLLKASSTNPVDATWLVTNPNFETSDETGWTLVGKEDGNNEFKVRDYGMSGKDGYYLFNAYQWWGKSLGVTQTVENVPSGVYELSAVVATWEGREVITTVNGTTVTKTGLGDGTGINVTIPVVVGSEGRLAITVGSIGQWWVAGHEEEKQTFFKVDNVRLVCKGLYLDGMAEPLPNDNTTLLTPGQWYYYDASYATEYLLRGNITDMVCTTDGTDMLANATTQQVEHRMTLGSGRVYFKTTQSNATLSIETEKELESASFTAVALNVDGLPQKVAFVTLNEDGPGTDGTRLISQYLKGKGYDFIGVSEDFNYHGSLMSAIDEDYNSGTVRATLSLTELSIPFDTDGLNLIWKESTVTASNESWTRWTDRTDTEGNQYVKKGFRHYDMQLDNGMEFDVYVLHMDAGDAITSRESQWRQLADAINASDASRPKIVLGDTNSRWTREDINTNFFTRLADFDVSDAWVELCRGNLYPTTALGDITDQSDPNNFSNYEVVDKIIYLNPKTENTLILKPRSFRIEQDYTYGYVQGTSDTKPLGDHRPVVVEFDCFKSGNAKRLIPDVNRDGFITVTDVTAAVDILLNRDDTQQNIYDHVAADVNMDGTVNITDITNIVNIVLSGQGH